MTNRILGRIEKLEQQAAPEPGETQIVLYLPHPEPGMCVRRDASGDTLMRQADVVHPPNAVVIEPMPEFISGASQ